MEEHRQLASAIVTTAPGSLILGDIDLYGLGVRVVVLFNYHSLQLIQIDASVLLGIRYTIDVHMAVDVIGLIIYHQ